MAKFSYLANSDANTVWVVISRGVQIGTWMSYDRENQESYSEEADYESMQDTDQYQSTVQLEMLEEHISCTEMERQLCQCIQSLIQVGIFDLDIFQHIRTT